MCVVMEWWNFICFQRSYIDSLLLGKTLEELQLDILELVEEAGDDDKLDGEMFEFIKSVAPENFIADLERLLPSFVDYILSINSLDMLIDIDYLPFNHLQFSTYLILSIESLFDVFLLAIFCRLTHSSSLPSIDKMKYFEKKNWQKKFLLTRLILPTCPSFCRLPHSSSLPYLLLAAQLFRNLLPRRKIVTWRTRRGIFNGRIPGGASLLEKKIRRTAVREVVASRGVMES